MTASLSLLTPRFSFPSSSVIFCSEREEDVSIDACGGKERRGERGERREERRERREERELERREN